VAILAEASDHLVSEHHSSGAVVFSGLAVGVEDVPSPVELLLGGE